MNRADRRRFEKEFPIILRKDGDHCTLCGRELQHNVKTFGGMTPGGKVALTTECCRAKLAVELVSGLYTTRHSETLPDQPKATARRPRTTNTDKAGNGIDAFHAHFEAMDGIAADARRRGGVKGTAHFNLKDSDWKADDAAWFASRPDRSHRLRPMAEDEASTYPPGLVDQTVPEGHRFEVVIRQIEPGKRIRLPFGRNLAVPIPDHEAIIHALFDRIAAGSGPGRVVSVGEIAEIARLHDSSDRTARN